MIKKILILSSIIFTLYLIGDGTVNRILGQSKDKSDSEVHFRLDVELRLIDVIVVDKDGNHVEGLTPDDFIILEEGQRQQIVTFDLLEFDVPNPYLKESEDSQKATAVRGTQAEERTSKSFKDIDPASRALYRTIFLLFDTYNSNPTQLKRAKDAAVQFINNDLVPNDRVAILKYHGGIEVLQDLTSNKDRLINAVDSMSVTIGTRIKVQDVARDNPLRMASDNPDDENINFDQGRDVMNFIDSIEALSSSLQNINGRKNIILFSPGFANLSSTINKWLFSGTGRAIKDISGNNVSIYSIDVGGLTVDRGEEQQDRWDFLTSISERTGGRLLKDSNNFQQQIARINYEISKFYVLGYYPTVSYQDGRYVDIKVLCRRPDTEVRTTGGLYTPKSWVNLTTEERKFKLYTFLNLGILFSDFPLQVDEVSTYPSQNGNIIFPLSVRFPVPQQEEPVTAEATDETESPPQTEDYLYYDLFMRIRDPEKFDLLGTYYKEIKINRNAVIGDQIIVNLPLQLEYGRSYLIDIIVKNNLNLDASAKFLKINMPDKVSEFAVSEPRLFTDDNSATMMLGDKGSMINPADYYPYLLRNLVPVTNRKIRSDVDNFLYFSIIDFPLDNKTNKADVDLEISMSQNDKPLNIKPEIKEFYIGNNENRTMIVLAKIAANSVNTGIYKLNLSCKNRRNEKTYKKEMRLYFTNPNVLSK